MDTPDTVTVAEMERLALFEVASLMRLWAVRLGPGSALAGAFEDEAWTTERLLMESPAPS